MVVHSTPMFGDWEPKPGPVGQHLGPVCEDLCVPLEETSGILLGSDNQSTDQIPWKAVAGIPVNDRPQSERRGSGAWPSGAPDSLGLDWF